MFIILPWIKMENDECSAVMNLRNYLRIKTEQPIPDYGLKKNFFLFFTFFKINLKSWIFFL